MKLPARVVLWYVRQPRPGEVKTRLAASLGDQAACDLYRAFAQAMLARFDELELPVVVCHTPESDPAAMRRWLGEERFFLPQRGEDLGARMAASFADAFDAGAREAVLVGSDVPDLPAETLAEAFDHLGRDGAVIGPATDGGYWLIGFTRQTFTPAVFREMPWSGPEVFARTMAAFAEAGLRPGVLGPWRDVDDMDDLRELDARLRMTGEFPELAKLTARLTG